jgi:hypothetical protein
MFSLADPAPTNVSTCATTVGPRAAPPLTARAARWLDTLPADLSLARLRRCCPELLDEMARHWNDRQQLQRIFDRCLFADRAGGLGEALPFEALDELAALKLYAAACRPRFSPSVWETALWPQAALSPR